MNPSAIPELLAPAGSPEALRAAVAAGADAVYLGGRHFGARKYAANFSDEELSAAIAYCHARDVRVYVTVNTLVRDDELAAAGAYLCWLHDEGADAVLVQDAGICALAREAVPDLPLHASTQMTVHSAAGVLWAVQQGIRRVVLARECSLGDVERIGSLCRDRHVGLEVFVHGALCYCYSGQCLFSSMIGGRSGNRGTCAQPCRKPYTPVAGSPEDEGNPARMHDIPLAERYLLSPRDLCIYPHLERVASAPVCSLKIEGRMKSAEYVAIVVDIYRRALDAIAGGTWCPSEQDMQKLLFAFNRSFTGGYLMGDRGRSLIGPERPDNRGVYAGTIRSYDPRRNEVVIAIDGVMPEAGDGLAVLSQKKGPEEVGMIVRPPFLIADGTVRVRVPRPVSRGSPVFITRRASLAAEAERIIARGRTRRVPVDLAMSFEENVPCLEGTVAHAGVPVHAAVRADAPWEPARNNPLSASRIRELVGRSGDTPFSVGTFSLSYPGNLFAPVGAVNRLRRELFSALEDALVLSFRPRPKMPASEPCTARFSLPPLPRLRSRRLHAPVLAAYVETPGTLAGAVAGGCGRIYYEPQAGPCGEGESLLPLLENAISRCHAGGAALIWKWPRIAGTAFRRQAAGILKRAMEEGLDGVMIAGGGEALTVRNCCPDLPLFGSAALNVF
ncbi:MAG: U32 family peptidase, partial [Methanomicrobiales archaeon]|nr:U32 family peptidase [Methanomicrobiales archaeon]